MLGRLESLERAGVHAAAQGAAARRRSSRLRSRGAAAVPTAGSDRAGSDRGRRAEVRADRDQGGCHDGAKRRRGRAAAERCSRMAARPKVPPSTAAIAGGAAARGRRLARGAASWLDADADGVRRRQSEGAAVLSGRGAGGGRRSAGRAVCRPRRAAAEQDHRSLQAEARRRLHPEHAQVPAAGESQPAAGRAGELPPLPGAAVGADPAGVHLLPGGGGVAESAWARRRRSASCAASCTPIAGRKWSARFTRRTCCATRPRRRTAGTT